jgi:hypothetical protein
MSLGKLQCVGSTHFLKSTYGAGYNLIFDKRSSATASQVLHLTQFIQTHIPGAVYNPPPNTDAEVQLQYTLPFDSVSQFGPFFLALDNNLADLCVSKYGVTITSLEDVFLKVDSHSLSGHLTPLLRWERITQSNQKAMSKQELVPIVATK